MTLPLPPILRLLTPDETPDLRRNFVAFCRVLLDRGEPLPTYEWYTQAIEQRAPRYHKSSLYPELVRVMHPDDIIMDDTTEPVLSPDEQRRLTEALSAAYERVKARGWAPVLVLSRLEE